MSILVGVSSMSFPGRVRDWGCQARVYALGSVDERDILVYAERTMIETNTVGLVDYGAGNLHSVETALEDLRIPCRLVQSPADLAGIDMLILPGVGACVDCVRELRKKDLWLPLRDWLQADKPYFGICIGYQILFDHSDEFEGTECLGHLRGPVVRFPSVDLKVPHMWWNNIRFRDPSDPLWQGLPADPYVYFVHSYYPQPEDEGVVSSVADYGGPFAASVRQGRLVATQFHPEKSQRIGLRLLRNFVESTAAVSVA